MLEVTVLLRNRKRIADLRGLFPGSARRRDTGTVEAVLRSREGERVPQRITLAADLIDQPNDKARLVRASEHSCPKWDETVR